MRIVNTSKYPNQEFRYVADGVEYTFRLHYWDELMFCSVYINGEIAIESVRCISGKWLIPYQYLVKGGNFRFECVDNSVYPNFNDFGVSCNLVYYTKEEYEAMKSNVQ